MVENNMIKSLLSFKIAERSEGANGQSELCSSAPAPRMILQATPSAQPPTAHMGTIPNPLSDSAFRPHKKPNNG